MKIYIQIGANIGNDSFQKMVEHIDEKIKILLIEPNAELLEELSNNYEKLRNNHEVIIVPHGISLINGDAVMYLYPESGHSTLINRKTRPSEDKAFKKVSITTFNTLCEKFFITDIEYLYIDTEGLDYEILNSIDLSKINIKTIVFEKWPIEDDDLSQNYRTGTMFLNNFIKPKFKDYRFDDIVVDGMPSYKLTKMK